MDAVKDKFLLLYYAFLVLVMALYTNTSSSPNFLLRIGYLVAIVAPLFKNSGLFMPVMVCFLGISMNTFALPLLPEDIIFYITLSIPFALIFAPGNKDKTVKVPKVKPMFWIALIYVFLLNIMLSESLPKLVSNYFLCLLIFCAARYYQKQVADYAPLAFMAIALVLSCWAIFCEDAKVNNYNHIGDEEQAGWMDPNYLGVIISFGPLLCVKQLLDGIKNRYQLIFSIATLILSIIGLAVIASRGAIIALAVGALSLIFISNFKKSRKISIIAIIVAALFVLYINGLFDLLLVRFEMEDATGNGRTVIWEKKLDAFFSESNPFQLIFGYGYDGGINLGHFGRGRAFHNDFVAILVEYGFVGLVTLVSAIVYPIRKCNAEMRPTIICFLIMLIACSMTVEPLAFGNMVYLCFYMYIVVLSHYSNSCELNYGK